MKLLKGLLISFILSLAPWHAHAAEKVNVAVASVSTNFATIYVAKAKDYFNEVGLDVTIQDVGKGSNVVASLVGGSVDIAGLGIANLAATVKGGQPLKAFATATRGAPSFLVVGKAFQKSRPLKFDASFEERVRALKGATIAVNDIGGSAGDFVRDILRRAGMSESDVTMINISSGPGRLATLKAGKIDAVIGYTPEPETAKLEGYGDIFIRSDKDIPESLRVEYIVWVAPEKTISEKPEMIKKFAKGLEMAATLMRDHPDDARNAYFSEIRKKSNSSAVDAESEALQWENMRPFFAIPTKLDAAAVKAAWEYFHLPKEVTQGQMIDYSVSN